jgi:probable rRNA maturation factor
VEISEINFIDIEENRKYIELAEKVLKECFLKENLQNKKLYVNVIYTNSKKIKEINNEYRNINSETDVLSFPMFEKKDLAKIKGDYVDVLGDIVISIEQVQIQAVKFNHSFERELAYMIVHAFFHLVGYDHIKEEDKKIMREKEETILKVLDILK